MLDPYSFETELRDQPVTVEIIAVEAPNPGSDVEPPTDLDIEFAVFGSDNWQIVLTESETETIFVLCVEHLKYAAEERDL